MTLTKVTVTPLIKRETNDENLFIFDMYNLDCDFGKQRGVFIDSLGQQRRPRRGADLWSKEAINYNFPTTSRTTSAEYFTILEQQLPKAIEECQPDIIIYNAGTDILQGDGFGAGIEDMTKERIIERDEFVFRQATNQKIPVCMLFSGGYSPDNAKLIGDSLTNLIETFFKKDVEKLQQ